MVEGITKVMESLGIPSQATTIIISRSPRRIGLQAANCIQKSALESRSIAKIIFSMAEHQFSSF